MTWIRTNQLRASEHLAECIVLLASRELPDMVNIRQRSMARYPGDKSQYTFPYLCFHVRISQAHPTKRTLRSRSITHCTCGVDMLCSCSVLRRSRANHDVYLCWTTMKRNLNSRRRGSRTLCIRTRTTERGEGVPNGACMSGLVSASRAYRLCSNSR